MKSNNKAKQRIMCQFFKNLLNLICNGDDQFTNNHQVSNYIESCRKQESNNLIQILIDNLDGINELFRATNSSPTNSILTTYGVEKKMLGSDKSLILEFVDCMLKLNNSKLTSAVAVSGIIQSSIYYFENYPDCNIYHQTFFKKFSGIIKSTHRGVIEIGVGKGGIMDCLCRCSRDMYFVDMKKKALRKPNIGYVIAIGKMIKESTNEDILRLCAQSEKWNDFVDDF